MWKTNMLPYCQSDIIQTWSIKQVQQQLQQKPFVSSSRQDAKVNNLIPNTCPETVHPTFIHPSFFSAVYTETSVLKRGHICSAWWTPGHRVATVFPTNERSRCSPDLKESNELLPTSLRLFEDAAVTQWHSKTQQPRIPAKGQNSNKCFQKEKKQEKQEAETTSMSPRCRFDKSYMFCILFQNSKYGNTDGKIIHKWKMQ